MMLRRPAFLLAVAIALAAGGASARAGDIAQIRSATGVEVQASVEGGDRLVVMVIPGDGTRINGHLGVRLASQKGSDIWSDVLPRLTTVKSDYFHGAVRETVHFDGKALTSPASLGVTYGACLKVTDICVYEEALVTLSPATGGSPDLTLTEIKP